MLLFSGIFLKPPFSASMNIISLFNSIQSPMIVLRTCSYVPAWFLSFLWAVFLFAFVFVFILDALFKYPVVAAYLLILKSKAQQSYLEIVCVCVCVCVYLGRDDLWWVSGLHHSCLQYASVFFLGAMIYGVWDLKFLTKDWTHAPCIGRTES